MEELSCRRQRRSVVPSKQGEAVVEGVRHDLLGVEAEAVVPAGIDSAELEPAPASRSQL